MLPLADLVYIGAKMSETTRRSQRLATDFSIARILAADEPCSSSSSSSSSSSYSSPYVSGFPGGDRVPKSSRVLGCPCCPGNSAVVIPTPEGINSVKLIPGDREEVILNSERIGCPPNSSDPENKPSGVNDLPWLHCTRYRPPRLPKRSSAGKISKRRPGKHPRIPFTPFQLQILEDKYKKGAYLARRDVVQLSLILRLPQSRVKIWFQNRRARERRESVQSLNETTKSDKDVVDDV